MTLDEALALLTTANKTAAQPKSARPVTWEKDLRKARESVGKALRKHGVPVFGEAKDW